MRAARRSAADRAFASDQSRTRSNCGWSSARSPNAGAAAQALRRPSAAGADLCQPATFDGQRWRCANARLDSLLRVHVSMQWQRVRLFAPTARQTQLAAARRLAGARLRALSALLGDRECQCVGLACQAGARHLAVRHVPRRRSPLFNHIRCSARSRLARPLLNLLRPSIVLVAIALAAAAFGIVLLQCRRCPGLAAALLILSLARPAPEPE